MPSGSPPYTLDGRDRVLDWLAATDDPTRRNALLLWLRMVCLEPDDFTTATFRHGITGRLFSYADVPSAQTRVTFVRFDAPVRAVRVVDINDADYDDGSSSDDDEYG